MAMTRQKVTKVRLELLPAEADPWDLKRSLNSINIPDRKKVIIPNVYILRAVMDSLPWSSSMSACCGPAS